ncbi:GntR family transcriptional regulator [Luteolibacter sp. LG18]|uniref:GntR family transcriptional regulator n=1 Tax=Luteolibacter sp. LG18 TaxID=2819286 RepID=UPI002B28D4F3|nr:hypothetical protein llg_42480 [Luteolibacter sp. LG18]
MDWKPKYAQVVETLRTLVSSGEWQDVLPGYRVLEERLKVSRPTLEKALAELTAEGLLAEPEPRRGRRVLVAPSPVIANADIRSLLILGPASYHELDWETQSEVEILTSNARAEGWRIAYDQFAFLHFRNPGSYLERIVKNHRPERVVLLEPTLAVARWFQSNGIPFFCNGGVVGEIASEVDGADTPIIQMAQLAIAHLHEQGHRRILAPLSPRFENIQTHLLDAALGEGSKDLNLRLIERLHPVYRTFDPGGLNAHWDDWMRATAPTAVVVEGSREITPASLPRGGSRFPHDHAASASRVVRAPTGRRRLRQFLGGNGSGRLSQLPHRIRIP